MEIIGIEKQAFEAITSKFNYLTERVRKLSPSQNDIKKEWLDNQEVCQLLNISKRTLEYYRNSGKISHSQIGNKNYYKVSDIEDMVKKLHVKK